MDWITETIHQGQFFYTQGNLTAACACFESAAKKNEEIHGYDHHHFILVNNHIGLVLRDLSSDESLGEAESYLTRALQASEKLFSPESLAVTIVLNNLGCITFDKGYWKKACDIFEQALNQYDQVFGKNHPASLPLLENLTRVAGLWGDQRFSIAIDRLRNLNIDYYMRDNSLAFPEYLILNEDFLEDLPTITDRPFQRILRIDERELLPFHADVANAILNLGYRLENDEEFLSAERDYERVIRIYEGLYGLNSSKVADLTSHTGKVLQQANSFSAASRWHERALSIYERIYGRDHIRVIEEVHNLGASLGSLGNFEKARLCFERALQVEQRLEPDSVNLATMFRNLGWAFCGLKNFSEARVCSEKAIEILERISPSGDQELELAQHLLQVATKGLEKE